MDILDFQSELDAMSMWRKRELSQAHMLAGATHHGKEEEKYLCRSWVLIMYAHCDNFLKESSKKYIEFLESNAVLKDDHKLIWFIFKGKNTIMPKSDNKYRSLKKYKEEYKNVSILDMSDIFNDKSFQYKYLRAICDWILQIEFDHESLKSFCLTLKDKRDAIAHGEQSYVEKIDDCLKWHKKTLMLIDSFKDSLLYSAQELIGC